MNRDKLREMGLSDENVSAIMAEYGKGVEAGKAEKEELAAKVKQLEAQITEANGKIEAFKSMDIDRIKAEAEEYKTKYEKTAKDSAREIEGIRLQHAVENGLRDAGARNIKAAAALLDMAKVTLNDDGTAAGLKEQLENIKKDNGFLFEGSREPAGGFKPAESGPKDNNTDPFIEGFNS